MRDHTKLKAFHAADELVVLVYQASRSFPREEQFGLTSQMRRAAVSVPANIAEGYGRYHYLDKIKFYYNSRGSLYESCDHWLELLFKRKKIQEDDYIKTKEIRKELGKKLNKLISAVFSVKDRKK